MHTFERGDYFFKQRVATQQIELYIRNLPGVSEDAEKLYVDSDTILKCIETQHGLLTERATGIYSFSHLTFHEYFTAKNILDSSKSVRQEEVLQKLVNHLSERRWQEIFLLVTEGMNQADYLLILMKQKIDGILAQDEKLQEFLTWIQSKADSLNKTYGMPAAIRAFYYDLRLKYDQALDVIIYPDLKIGNFDFRLDRSLNVVLELLVELTDNPDKSLNIDLEKQIKSIDSRLKKSDLRNGINGLVLQIPDKNMDDETWEKLWKRNGKKWVEQLKSAMIQDRNIGHDWEFDSEQYRKLKEYYYANFLLTNCLNSECYLSREVREEIEATMLLPMAEIEKWKAAKLGNASP
jgi:predicted NACHT family NTPase